MDIVHLCTQQTTPVCPWFRQRRPASVTRLDGHSFGAGWTWTWVRTSVFYSFVPRNHSWTDEPVTLFLLWPVISTHGWDRNTSAQNEVPLECSLELKVSRKPVAFYTTHWQKTKMLCPLPTKFFFWVCFSRENGYDNNQLLGPAITGMYRLAVNVSRVQ
jgi:hypothetical protein